MPLHERLLTRRKEEVNLCSKPRCTAAPSTPANTRSSCSTLLVGVNLMCDIYAEAFQLLFAWTGWRAGRRQSEGISIPISYAPARGQTEKSGAHAQLVLGGNERDREPGDGERDDLGTKRTTVRVACRTDGRRISSCSDHPQDLISRWNVLNGVFCGDAR